MKRWKVVVGVLLVFVLGAFTGGLVTHRIYQKRIHNLMSGPPAVRYFMVRAMTRELRLTPAQQVEVDNAIRDAQQEFQSIRKQVQPQVEEIIQRAEERVRKQLDAGQKEKFDKWAEQQRSRWKNPRID